MKYFFFFFQYMCHSCSVKRSFPIAANAQNGALGEKSIHSHPAKTFGDAKTTVSIRTEQVMDNILLLLCYFANLP